MREPLYRARRTNIGKWITGFFAYWDNKPAIQEAIFFDDGTKQGHVWAEVDPTTVGQFTGLLDKNGVRVFEGDILSIPDEHSGGNSTHDYGRVKWDEIYYSFALETQFDCVVFADLVSWDIGNCEVLGNIHDNPTLLAELQAKRDAEDDAE
jgi:uncharacterized phage protein (TIGR01671 family)